MKTRYFIVPGYGNSGEKHWQTYFQNSSPDFSRIEQTDWEKPEAKDWICAIEKTLENEVLENVVLVGHSLGCLAIAHWGILFQKKIKGAFLVAPPDLENPAHDYPIFGFTPIPLQKLPFESVMVYSTDDEWITPARALLFAEAWGSKTISIGNAGHISAVNGYGHWDPGLELLKKSF